MDRPLIPQQKQDPRRLAWGGAIAALGIIVVLAFIGAAVTSVVVAAPGRRGVAGCACTAPAARLAASTVLAGGDGAWHVIGAGPTGDSLLTIESELVPSSKRIVYSVFYTDVSGGATPIEGAMLDYWLEPYILYTGIAWNNGTSEYFVIGNYDSGVGGGGLFVTNVGASYSSYCGRLEEALHDLLLFNDTRLYSLKHVGPRTHLVEIDSMTGATLSDVPISGGFGGRVQSISMNPITGRAYALYSQQAGSTLPQSIGTIDLANGFIVPCRALSPAVEYTYIKHGGADATMWLSSRASPVLSSMTCE